MTAPLTLTNRFELLLTGSPASLPRVLDQFAESNISPATVNARSQRDGSLAVTVTVKQLGEEMAEILRARLKAVPSVKTARLEHLVS
jgi:hypothetical protein